MPAYFEMSLQFQRKDLYPDFIADFDAALERAGLRFKKGYWNGAGFTQAEIAVWNQKKLEADFELGDTEHYTCDYRQSRPVSNPSPLWSGTAGPLTIPFRQWN